MPHRLSAPEYQPDIRIEGFGESIPARQGESVAAALLAANKVVLSRSVKYHRPRGPFCLNARCSHCLVRVDGKPNQLACRTACQPGMRVEPQNVMGSARFDALSAIDFVFPRGLDHHSMFAGVPIVESMVAGVARHLAGLGTLPDKVAPMLAPAEVRQVDVAVVGAGPAGLAAALAAVEGGHRVELVDEQAQPGGHLLGAPAPSPVVERLIASLKGRDARLTLSTLVLGAYRDQDGPFLALRSAASSGGEAVTKLYAKRFVLCPGGTETLPTFEGNDTPGIFAARGLMRLIRAHGVVPGEKVVVLASHAEGLEVAETLAASKCKVVAVVDPSGTLSHSSLPLVHGRIEKASGGRLSRVKVACADGKVRAFSCDLLAVSAPVAPSFELARQLGLRADFTAGLGFTVGSEASGLTKLPGVAVAGEIAGALSTDACVQQGAAAGKAVIAGPEVAR